jgi:hypothetical protein
MSWLAAVDPSHAIRDIEAKQPAVRSRTQLKVTAVHGFKPTNRESQSRA